MQREKNVERVETGKSKAQTKSIRKGKRKICRIGKGDRIVEGRKRNREQNKRINVKNGKKETEEKERNEDIIFEV